jgi:SAM-dependent methyltransferase
MRHSDEAEEIRKRYERRKLSVEGDRYDPLRPSNLQLFLDREKAIASLLRKHLGTRKLADLDILEIGCGSGDNLLQMLRLGASPAGLQGNDLLEERLQAARQRLPLSVKLLAGNAVDLPIAPESLDIIMQFMVFSSILDTSVRHALADRMLQWLRPGGTILWYDFTFDNPNNKDVTGIRMKEIAALFPGCSVDSKRTTLAPPLARRVEKIPLFLEILSAIPLLRTHVVCMIAKPDAREAATKNRTGNST